jgi:DNA sulfur modification protein DndE
MRKLLTSVFFIGIALIMISCNSNKDSKASDSKKKNSTVKLLAEAYMYGYPVLTMDYTHKLSTNTVESDGRGKAPLNEWATVRQFPRAAFKGVVRPNLDTYYSLIYADLSINPLYIYIPATERYYLMPILNAFGDVIASPGSRTTGQGELHIALVGPSFKGEIDSDLMVVRSQTSLNWLVGRVAVKNDKDGVLEVENFQEKLIAKPLGERNNPNYVAPKGSVKPEYSNFVPLERVNSLDIVTYFNQMMALMVDNPPTKADAPLMEKLKDLGIVPGGTFDLSNFSELERIEIKKIPGLVQNKFKKITAKPKEKNMQNGWAVNTSELGQYGTDYAMRAYVTNIGYGANTPEDAIYPNAAVDIDGNDFLGDHKYKFHFDVDKLPPVKGFWSITMYTKEGFLVENSLNRYVLGSMKDMTYNKDGSLDIFIQNEEPESIKSNWLPSPGAGVEFELTFRMYWPGEDVLKRIWQMPGVEKME